MAGVSRIPLTLAGVAVLGISLLHVVIAIVGPAAYRFFGAGERMALAASGGSPFPALLTVVVAVVFALFGMYALSAAGRVRPLPAVRPGVLTMGVVFAVRGIVLIPQAIGYAREPAAGPLKDLLFNGNESAGRRVPTTGGTMVERSSVVAATSAGRD
jgi:hypothetical protein